MTEMIKASPLVNMTEMIKASPLVFIDQGIAYTSSTTMARYFGKEHNIVVRAINNLSKIAKITPGFFIETTYQDHGRTYPSYNLSRDGFALVGLGFTGKRALQFKLDFIQAFNAMEKQVGNVFCFNESAMTPVEPTKLKPIIRPITKPRVAGVQMREARLLIGDAKGWNLSDPNFQSLTVQILAAIGIDINVPAPSKMYTATEIADEVGISMQRLTRDDRYKSLKDIEANGMYLMIVDDRGASHSNWAWNATGRQTLLDIFGQSDQNKIASPAIVA